MKILSQFCISAGIACITAVPAVSHADTINPGGSLTLSEDAETLDYIDQNYSTADGLVITFSFSAWGTYLADGFALALFDADTATPTVGSYGGSLGYANRSNTDGLAGGVLGIGFDAHGNFSDGSEGRNGGIGRTINSVALRGSGSGTNGYEYITGTDSLDNFMNAENADTQAEAVTRDVRITVTADETVSVEWKLEDETAWSTLIDAVDASAQMDLTDEVKVGITSSLNGNTNIQIDDLEVIPEPAVITLVAGFGISMLSVRRIFVKT